LLAQTGNEYTSFQSAAEKSHVETIRRMWVLAKESQLNLNELNKKLSLVRIMYGYKWHRSAEQGSLEPLDTLWSLTKEMEINTDELLLA